MEERKEGRLIKWRCSSDVKHSKGSKVLVTLQTWLSHSVTAAFNWSGEENFWRTCGCVSMLVVDAAVGMKGRANDLITQSISLEVWSIYQSGTLHLFYFSLYSFPITKPGFSRCFPSAKKGYKNYPNLDPSLWKPILAHILHNWIKCNICDLFHTHASIT